MTYTPRRLRPPRPITILTPIGNVRVDADMAAQVRRQWLRARRTGVVVLDGTQWTVTQVTR